MANRYRLALLVPAGELLAYPKLSAAYFAYFEWLWKRQMKALCGLDTAVFLRLVASLGDGVARFERDGEALPRNTWCS